ncbi:MAG: DNA-binding protein [Candidatus Rokubacteria bacterium]|nr:DNA-binding protein [Candidatus Rokubacteria bacterium]
MCPPERRLLSVEAAATYLGVSTWTVRGLLAAGRLARVRLPLAGHQELRRVLLDVQDLDALVKASKEPR